MEKQEDMWKYEQLNNTGLSQYKQHLKLRALAEFITALLGGIKITERIKDMKIIYTYTKIKGSPKDSNGDDYKVNHYLDEANPDKAICGFDHSKSFSINGIYTEPEEMLRKITCKKCLKKLGKLGILDSNRK